VIRHPVVWELLGGFSLVNMVSYGFTLWLPSALKGISTRSIAEIGWLSALPYVAAIPGLLLVTRSSDKWRERRMHASLPMVMIGALLLAGVYLNGGSVVTQMVLFTLLGIGGILGGVLIFVVRAKPRRESTGPAALRS
jgi:sugar phosphate permease